MSNRKPGRSCGIIRHVITVALLGLMLGLPFVQSTRAQGDGAYFPIFVLGCDAYVKMAGSAKGEGYPPECRGLPGVKVTAYDTEGTRLDACTTGDDGTCRLAIDYNGMRIFEQSTTNIPKGYRAETNVQRTFTYTEFAEIAFHNYRDDVIPQRDSATATVRVHTRICPDNYTGDAFFDDCDPGLPKTDQWIFGNGTYARAGKDGNAILRDMPAATGSEIIGGQSYQTGDVFFYCSMTNDPDTRVITSLEVTALYDGITRDFVGKVNLNPNDDVTCDWYQIPFLDRGLSDVIFNAMAQDPTSGMFEGGTGIVDLHLYKCPEGTKPADLQAAAKDCTDTQSGGTVRATTGQGAEIGSGTTDDNGHVVVDLTGKPAVPFVISLDGHDSAADDQITCVANRLNPMGGSTDPLYQQTTAEGSGWSINGFGDDLNGVVCSWFVSGD